jgi:asparagine synthase (glutamine-hydrolysing)
VWQIRSFWRDDLDPLSRMQYADVNTYLPDDILTKVDRASMAVSLEVRPPLLDHRVAEILASLPVKSRLRDGISKYTLKQVLRKWLPDELVDRRKRGFSVPWMHWLSPSIVRSRLLDGALVQCGIVDSRLLANLPERQLSGGKAWTLLVLEEWARRNNPSLAGM